MSEFLDNQAEVSSNDDSDSDSHEPRAKKPKRSKKVKKSKKQRISDDEEEDEEDDDARLKEEMRGFVVEGDDDEGGDDDDDDDDDDDKSEKSGGSLGELSEEDLDLINDNIGVERTGGRVVIEEDDDDDVDDRDRIGNQIFSNDDFVDRRDRDRDRREREHQRRREYDDFDEGGSESERSEDNFIVHDEGRRPNRSHHHGKKRHDIAEGALDDARDIFGVEDFDFNEFYDEEAEVGDEEEEYQEDEDGEALPRVRRARKEKKNLLDIIEPSELERGFLSNEAKRIQLEDRPERFQLRRIPVVGLTAESEQEISDEAVWIYENAFRFECISRQDPLDVVQRENSRDETITKIRETVNFIRVKSYEVPFIAFYRKEYIENLDIGDLWRIYMYDEKWCHLQQSKEKLIKLMKRMQLYHEEVPVGFEKGRSKRPITEIDIVRVEQTNSLDSLTDLRTQFEMYYGAELKHMSSWEIKKEVENDPDKEEMSHAKFKLSGRQDKYTLCLQCGLEDLSRRFGLTPDQFADNLEWKRHEVAQEQKDPFTLASEYLSDNFANPEDVIKGAVHMLAKQLSREPIVRSKWRDLFRQRAVINCRPTKKGRAEIDVNHPLFPKRYLREKPVGEFEKTEYLMLWQGKKNGLLEYSIVVDRSDDIARRNTMVDAVLDEKPFYVDEFSDCVEEWNQLRRDVVAACINEFLIPKYSTELHEKLLSEAKDVAIKQIQATLWNKLKTAAFKTDPDEHMDEDDYDDIPDPTSVRIMSIVHSTEREEVSFGVLIDQDGQVVETLRMPNLTTRKNQYRPAETKRKEQDMDKFKKFIARKKPHIIGIAAENLDTVWIKQDLEEAVRQLLEDNELRRPIPIDYVDNEISKIFMNSKTGQQQFPEYPLLLRQAVSVARVILDPLIEYSQMCNADEDILCLSLHPLQSELPKDELKFAIEQEFINRVNEVGVDVNRCMELSHQANLVQFICGLGPRKADHLVKVVRQQEVLESRTKLVVGCKMGPIVFMNCAGFIKIDVHHVADRTDSYVEVLDGSRVHPETYEWARKMAVDALEIEDGTDPSSAIEEILQNPDRLRDLDLEAFAQELSRQNFGSKGITLYDIRAELTCRYKDLRPPYMPLDRETVFFLLTKESPETFCEEKMVCAKVLNVAHRRPRDEQSADPVREIGNSYQCAVCYKTGFQNSDDVYQHRDTRCPGQPIGVRMKFDNGLTGFIPNKFLSDKNEQFMDPSTRVQPGQPIWCKILKIDIDKMSCDLSCRSSDLRSCREKVDSFFDSMAENDDNEAEKRQKQRKSQVNNFVKRVISHPAFHNVSFKDAERILMDLNQGEAIIRPSSKSAHHLTVTWKVSDNVFQHIDVEEQEKEQMFSLGKKLIINSEVFEDLDEIIARHIQPMANFAQDILSHKYSVNDLKSEQRESLERRLQEEKKRNPRRIPYLLTPSVELPGKFTISYLPRVKVRHEYMTVTPEGIRFRQRMFINLEQLLGWFKLHFADPMPQAAQPPMYQRRPVEA